MKPQEPLITGDELRRSYPISRRELLRWTKEENCPYVKKGRLVYYKKSAVDRWFRQNGEYYGDWRLEEQ